MKTLLIALGASLCAIGGASASTISFAQDVLMQVTAEGPPIPAVPEPATWGLMILGFTLLAAKVRSRRKATA